MGVHPNRRLGQNFLVDRNILRILLQAAELSPEDEVLEVGSGLGVVTEQLLLRARRVVAVERDRRLVEFLQRRLGHNRNLELISSNMLDVSVDGLLKAGINKVVSNLPFSSASRIIVNMLHAEEPARHMVLTIQEEVAERLASGPGSRSRSILSVWSELYYEVDLVKGVSAACFWPKPKVQSMIVRMVRHDHAALKPKERRTLYALTKLTFRHRRKQLAVVVSGAPGWGGLTTANVRELLTKCDIDARARPEDLSLAEWCAISTTLTALG